jgi:hypothetical protein
MLEKKMGLRFSGRWLWQLGSCDTVQTVETCCQHLQSRNMPTGTSKRRSSSTTLHTTSSNRTVTSVKQRLHSKISRDMSMIFPECKILWHVTSKHVLPTALLSQRYECGFNCWYIKLKTSHLAQNGIIYKLEDTWSKSLFKNFFVNWFILTPI